MPALTLAPAPAPAPACASADCWPGTGDNGEGDEAMSAAMLLCCCARGARPGRHRVDTLGTQAAGHEDNQEG